MNMQEALEWAADYAERNKLFQPVTNARGYADGWKPPTPAEKARVITELAKEACAPDSAVTALLLNLHGWANALGASDSGSGNWLEVRRVVAEMRTVLGA